MADKEEFKEKAPKETQSKTAADKKVLDDLLSKPAGDLIPWEECVLPSQGVYYDGKIPGGRIEVRAWGIQTDKILATSRLAQTGKSLDHLLNHCIRLPNEFDHMNLLVGDRIFLLYYLRGITYGNEYEFLIECTNDECRKATTETYDLNELAKTIRKPNSEIGLEPFKVSLPYLSEYTKTDFWVKVRLLRGYDLSNMMRQKRMKKTLRSAARVRARTGKERDAAPVQDTLDLDRTIEDNLKLVITEAMGENNPRRIEQLVGRLHAADTATIREFLRDNSPGIETTVEVECPECGNTMTMELPITESFFRPTRSGSDGKRVLENNEPVLPS